MRSYLDDIDYETVKQRFDAFWKRELVDRPLAFITSPKEKQIKADFPVPEKIEERWTNVDYVLKKLELQLENTLFLGDAIPYVIPNLGPDHFSACLGANLIFKDEVTSWAEPFVEDLTSYSPVFDKSNRWWKLMNDLLDSICSVAKGNFLVGVPDLHYGADSLRALVGSHKLALFFFRKPEEVKRLIKELSDICIEMFEHYYAKISRVQDGSITWIPAYSRGRYFALQDDYSCFLSPKMFKDFLLEDVVEKMVKHLDNSFFHLDGPLALGNLDVLLRVEPLDGIQWVPGVAAEPMSKWLDICTKILNANKCLFIGCNPYEVEFLLSKLKHEGLFLYVYCDAEKEARKVLKIVESFAK